MFLIFFEIFILFTLILPFFSFASLDGFWYLSYAFLQPFVVLCFFMFFVLATLLYFLILFVITTFFYCLCLLLFFSNTFSYTPRKTAIGKTDAWATTNVFLLLKYPGFSSCSSPKTVSNSTLITLPVIVQQLPPAPFLTRYFPPNSSLWK